MTFAQIRTQFITLSGRSDFEDTAGSQAEFFIKAGYDYLASLLSLPGMYTKRTTTLLSNINTFSSVDDRAIKSVYVIDGDNVVKLNKLTMEEFMQTYGNSTHTNSKGKPIDYTIDMPGPGDSNSLDTTSLRVIVGPRPDKTYMIEYIALPFDRFYDLSGSTQWQETKSNWLATNYPDLVIQAALYKLEVFYRNVEGAKGWLDGITEAVKHIDFDKVETELADVSTMTEQYKLDRSL
tara:strand:- start:12558 stop:13265 length:708 start_codon:yes stop_codon:yes gene_type:complete